MKQVPTCWTEPSDLFLNSRILRTLSKAFAIQAGETGQLLNELIDRNDYHGLLNFEIDYNLDWSTKIDQLIAARQALAFYQKNDSLEVGIDRSDVAYQGFIKAETSCAFSNALFRAVRHGSGSLLPYDCVIFHHARNFIGRVLGSAPRIGDLKLRFGPGATATIKRSRSSPCFKLAETPSCSTELYASGLLPSLFREMPHWLDCHESERHTGVDGCGYSIVDIELADGRLQFVPKNAKTDRVIDSQPTLNTMVQAGVGDYMMRRLKRFGLDLKDQAPNQRLARRGSIDGQLATIDLRSASDTICRELVKYLLPDDWYQLLSACRCGTTTLRGETIILEKFCSMGNGFTFPLESLIFWALTRATVKFYNGDALLDSTVSVYGDDIICPSWAYDRIVNTLNVAGFEVNSSKSYSTGSFRESCGSDFYNGISVRPYYCRTVISARTLFTMHNFFHRNFDEETCILIRSFIPKPLWIFGPDGYGDGHLVSDDWRPLIKGKSLRRGFGGVFFDSFSLPGRFITTPYYGDYVTPLYSLYIRERSSPASPLEDSPLENRFLDDGRVCWPLPGDDSGVYQRKQIYTFLR